MKLWISTLICALVIMSVACSGQLNEVASRPESKDSSQERLLGLWLGVSSANPHFRHLQLEFLPDGTLIVGQGGEAITYSFPDEGRIRLEEESGARVYRYSIEKDELILSIAERKNVFRRFGSMPGAISHERRSINGGELSSRKMALDNLGNIYFTARSPYTGSGTGQGYLRVFNLESGAGSSIVLQNESDEMRPTSVAVDDQENLYITDKVCLCVRKLNRNGETLQRIGPKGGCIGWKEAPVEVELDKTGRIWVLDGATPTIEVFDSQGSLLFEWGSDSGLATRPSGMTIASNGYVYIAANDIVQKFTVKGSLVATWGERGNGLEQFDGARGIAIGTQGNVYVAEGINERIQKFDPQGNLLNWWSVNGTPSDLVIDASGQIYVTYIDPVFEVFEER